MHCLDTRAPKLTARWQPAHAQVDERLREDAAPGPDNVGAAMVMGNRCGATMHGKRELHARCLLGDKPCLAVK